MILLENGLLFHSRLFWVLFFFFVLFFFPLTSFLVSLISPLEEFKAKMIHKALSGIGTAYFFFF